MPNYNDRSFRQFNQITEFEDKQSNTTTQSDPIPQYDFRAFNAFNNIEVQETKSKKSKSSIVSKTQTKSKEEVPSF